jgi:hypothetical protein
MSRLSMGLNRMLLVGALTLAAMSVASAAEQTLGHGTGLADTYEHLTLESHYIKLDLPVSWKTGFTEEVQFYGHRYGDVKGLKGTVVIWGNEKEAKLGSRSHELGPIKKIYSKQFDLSAVPEQPGWFSLPIETMSLPPVFALSLYTASDETRGLKLGLTAKTTGASYSSAMYPSQLGTHTPIKMRRDGRNWLLRLKVRDSLNPPVTVSSSDLAGASYLALDDGTAEDFVTVQKKGFLLRCERPTASTINSVFVFGKLDGKWLGSKRSISVAILDRDLKLLSRTSIPYSAFTNVPSWGQAQFSPTTVGPLHYISVEPTSRPTEQFLIGYDTSNPNQASSFGTIGAELAWPFTTLAQGNTNWMIRVKYGQ